MSRPDVWRVLLFVVALAGCERQIDVAAVSMDSFADASDVRAIDHVVEGIVDSPSGDGREAYCMGRGPPILLDQRGEQLCAGKLAEQTFRYAVCSCGDFDTGRLTTRSFEGTISSEAGAAVAVNGALTSSGQMDVGGSLFVSGGDSLILGENAAVRGDLRLGTEARTWGSARVHRDAWIEGGVRGFGSLHVQRDVYLLPGGSREGVSGAIHESNFVIDPPCPCNPDQRFDIQAMVAGAAIANHNADIGLDPGELSDRDRSYERELPCGRFYLDRVNIRGGEVTLRVPARTALFIGNNFEVTAGVLRIDTGAEGELDLFVAGDLRLEAWELPAASSRPAGVRVYVAGSRVSLAGVNPERTTFVGNLYAPNATVQVRSLFGFEVRGSIFAGRLVTDDIDVHYDRSILDVGGDCPNPPAGCVDWRDCRSTESCIAGRCGSCEADGDCAAPLACQPDGRCEPLLI